MAKKSFTTPIGVARFPKISKPDTTGEYADNKYKTDLVLSDDELKAINAQLVAFAKEKFSADEVKAIVGTDNWPIKSVKDKETKEVTKCIRFKSKRKPLIVDAHKNKIPDTVEIMGGSKVRIGYVPSTYTSPKKGVNLYLNAVQVIELVQGFDVNDFEDYDGEDAYDATEGFDSEDNSEKSEFDL